MSKLFSSIQRHRAFWMILGVGLIIRLAVLLLYLSTHNWKAETWEAEIVAVNMLEGRGFTIDSYGPHVHRSFLDPVFPCLLYLTHLIGGRGLWLYYVVQLALAGGILWLTYSLALRWFGVRVAVMASGLVALEPGLVLYHSYKVDDIALGTFLLLLGVRGCILLSSYRTVRQAWITGLIMSIAMLTRPDLTGLFGQLPTWAVLDRKRLGVVLRLALLVALAAVVVWAPWAVRNYLIQGQFVLITSFSGEALWLGNNPNSFGSTVTTDVRPLFQVAPPEFRQRIEAASEMEKDALFKEEARRFIASDPSGFLLRTLRKFYYFWWFIPTYATQYYEWVPDVMVEGYRLLYSFVLALALLGVWSVTRQEDAGLRRATFLMLAALLSIAAIHSITLVNGRHRVLVMPLTLIFAAHGIIALRGVFGCSDQRPCPNDRRHQGIS